MPKEVDGTSKKWRNELGVLDQVSYMIFYDLMQEEHEVELLCDLTSRFRDYGLVLQYIDIGNICIVRTEIDERQAEEIFEMIDYWFSCRQDISYYEISLPTQSNRKMIPTHSEDERNKQVLLLIPPSVH